MSRKGMDQSVTYLYGNSFTDLSQAKDKSLRHTIIDVLFQILDILMREQVPTVCTLDNSRRWRRRTRIGVASVYQR